MDINELKNKNFQRMDVVNKALNKKYPLTEASEAYIRGYVYMRYYCMLLISEKRPGHPQPS